MTSESAKLSNTAAASKSNRNEDLTQQKISTFLFFPTCFNQWYSVHLGSALNSKYSRPPLKNWLGRTEKSLTLPRPGIEPMLAVQCIRPSGHVRLGLRPKTKTWPQSHIHLILHSLTLSGVLGEAWFMAEEAAKKLPPPCGDQRGTKREAVANRVTLHVQMKCRSRRTQQWWWW